MRRVIVVLVVALLTACTPTPAPNPEPTRDDAPYLDSSLDVAERVADLLARMELADKIGQMTQAERGVAGPADVTRYRLGSVFSGGGSAPDDNTPEGWADMVDALQEGALATPLGIPLLYGVDAVHGHQLLPGATVFPHNIGLGATGDPDLVERIAAVTAVEVAATGASWNFAPCVAVVQDLRWGRTYESFGEDPALVTAMTSSVSGYQDNGVLATAKHYLGDGGTADGVDQGDVRVGEAELRATHLPPYAAAIERGVRSVMVSFSSWNGVKTHGDGYLITDLLKGELGFTGFVVSDWAGIDQIDGAQGFSSSDVTQAINAGVDMVMVPNDYPRFIETLTEAVESGDVPIERIDDAVSRILTVKFELGLFEDPFTDRSLADHVGNAEHRALAREAVAKSAVLLTNDGVLPLVSGSRVLVAGSNTDDIGNQSGGWTMTWQGESGDIIPGTTILEGLRDALDVEYSQDGTADYAGFDVAIAVVGETPYAEYSGDRPDGVPLSEEDEATLARLRASGLPTVVVVVSGRPMDITHHQWASAIVAARLPGSEGDGIARVLTGEMPFVGTLPVTWPRSTASPSGGALFPVGFGLSSSVP